MLFEDSASGPGAPAIDIIGIARRGVKGIAFVLDPEQLARALADFAGADRLLAIFEDARGGIGIVGERFGNNSEAHEFTGLSEKPSGI
jgi:hypothetical protein